MTFEVRAELHTDAALGASPATAFLRRGLRYVPGSVLRGALATRYLATGGSLGDGDFVEAFERGVRWGPLYVAGHPPQPLSWWVHKYAPRAGCPEYYDECVADLPTASRCSVCGGPLRPGRGELPGVATTIDAHVGIENGVARKGDLFARERLSHTDAKGRNVLLKGRVVSLTAAGKEALQHVTAALAEPRGTRVWLGGRRSTDGGRATITFHPTEIPQLRLGPPEDPGRLTFRLTSPGVFVDDYGRPQNSPSVHELAEVLAVAPGTIRLYRAWSRSSYLGGWHNASGLPKPVERVVDAGSVFQYQLQSTPQSGFLAALVSRGLGLRKCEGFGEVSPMPLVSIVAETDLVTTLPLRTLSDQLKAAVLSEIRNAAEEIDAGLAPTWNTVKRIASGPPAMLAANSAAGPKWVAACQHILTLDSPVQLRAVADHVEKTR